MNVKSIYETLAALGTSAMIAGCGASQAPTNTAEQPLPETPSATTADTNGSKEAASSQEVIRASAVAEQKPSATNTAEPAPANTMAASPMALSTTAPASKPGAAKATPVQKKPAAAPTKTTAKTTPKKDAGMACGEGGCG